MTTSKKIWKVKLSNGAFMTGTHTFRTKRAALVFIRQWRKSEQSADASVTLTSGH